MQTTECSDYQHAIAQICDLNWENLTQDELMDVTRCYYYFSIQFRESLEAALVLYPEDDKLRELEAAECKTANLSPWLGVAVPGEEMDHDEFMRRSLELVPVDDSRRQRLDLIGHGYLQNTRTMAAEARARSIASYEDGGLERVFRAMLTAQHWGNPTLQAFRHFLVEHIRFDSHPENGHGALSRHLFPDDKHVLPLWSEFKRILLESAPSLSR